jgi:hypothetical protein
MSQLTYENVRGLVQQRLTAAGYSDDAMPAFSPGPASDPGELKTSPDAIVFLTVGGGAGLTKEQTFDRPFISAHVVGPQRDYAAGERLALDVDRALLWLDSSDDVGGSWTLGITRTGGRPALLLKDPAERYHFTASYIAEAETGI